MHACVRACCINIHGLGHSKARTVNTGRDAIVFKPQEQILLWVRGAADLGRYRGGLGTGDSSAVYERGHQPVVGKGLQEEIWQEV